MTCEDRPDTKTWPSQLQWSGALRAVEGGSSLPATLPAGGRISGRETGTGLNVKPTERGPSIPVWREPNRVSRSAGAW